MHLHTYILICVHLLLTVERLQSSNCCPCDWRLYAPNSSLARDRLASTTTQQLLVSHLQIFRLDCSEAVFGSLSFNDFSSLFQSPICARFINRLTGIA